MSFQLPAGYRPAAPPQGGAAGPQGAQAGQANDEERAAKQAQVAEMKRGMIQQILEPEARERREWSSECRAVGGVGDSPRRQPKATRQA